MAAENGLKLTVTNVSDKPVFVSDLYSVIKPQGSVVVTRSPSDLPSMYALQKFVADGILTLTYEASDRLIDTIQGQPVDVVSTPPVTDEKLGYDGEKWVPQEGGGLPAYGYTVCPVITTVVSGSEPVDMIGINFTTTTVNSRLLFTAKMQAVFPTNGTNYVYKLTFRTVSVGDFDVYPYPAKTLLADTLRGQTVPFTCAGMLEVPVAGSYSVILQLQMDKDGTSVPETGTAIVTSDFITLTPVDGYYLPGYIPTGAEAGALLTAKLPSNISIL